MIDARSPRNRFAQRRLVLAPLALLLGACSPSPGDVTGTAGNGGSSASGAAGASATGGSAAGAGGTSTTTGIGGAGSGQGGLSATSGTAGSAASGSGGSSTTVGSGGTSAGGSGGPGGVGGSTSGRGGGAGGAGATGSGGTAAGGRGGAVAGAGGAGGTGTTGPFQKAAGTIPNSPQPASTVNLPKADWQRGIISPSLQVGKQIAQPSVINGYLVIAGNEEFWIYDVSNPAAPKQLSSFSTPNRTGGEAESHTVSFARYGNTFYMVTIGGRGIDIWDVTNLMAPRHVKQLAIPGTNYGDYTEAVWGVSWQGQYIYVGATNNGIKVVDAANPAAPTIVDRGSHLAVRRRQRGPARRHRQRPGRHDAEGERRRRHPGHQRSDATPDPARVVHDRHGVHRDVLPALRVPDRRQARGTCSRTRAASAPAHRRSGASPTEGSEYMSLPATTTCSSDTCAPRSAATPGASKITVANPRSMRVTSRIWGRLNLGDKNDDQFTIPIGNLLVIGDDQAPYHGWFIAVHQAEPDTKPPVVDTVIPQQPGDRRVHEVAHRADVLGQHRARDRERGELHRPPRRGAAAARASGACAWAS